MNQWLDFNGRLYTSTTGLWSEPQGSHHIQLTLNAQLAKIW